MFELWMQYTEMKRHFWQCRTLGIGDNNEEHAKQLRQLADEIHMLESKGSEIIVGSNNKRS